MKDDAPTPAVVPKKRRQLEQSLDRWLAEWLDRDDLTPSERRRVEEIRAERKAAVPDRVIGIMVGREGFTPEQLQRVADLVRDARPTALLMFGPASRRLLASMPPGLALGGAADFQEVARSADLVIAAPKEPDVPNQKTGVWAGVKYAKHRRVAVRVVLPNGEEA